MKAKDLMNGNWVAVRRPGDRHEQVRVKSVIGNGTIEAKTSDGLVAIGEIAVEPIPLTAEILEKNGFSHRQSEVWGDFYTYTYAIEQRDKVLQYDQHFNLSPDPYEGDGFHWIPEMSAVPALRVVYVHELQQLLRLCKIEKEIIL
jgi:hypothetical protein